MPLVGLKRSLIDYFSKTRKESGGTVATMMDNVRKSMNDRALDEEHPRQTSSLLARPFQFYNIFLFTSRYVKSKYIKLS